MTDCFDKFTVKWTIPLLKRWQPFLSVPSVLADDASATRPSSVILSTLDIKIVASLLSCILVFHS